MDTTSSFHGTTILQPLSFPESVGDNKANAACFLDAEKDFPIPCLLCEQCFSNAKAREEFLRHMLCSHKIVIHGTRDISSWKWLAIRIYMNILNIT